MDVERITGASHWTAPRAWDNPAMAECRGGTGQQQKIEQQEVIDVSSDEEYSPESSSEQDEHDLVGETGVFGT